MFGLSLSFNVLTIDVFSICARLVIVHGGPQHHLGDACLIVFMFIFVATQ